MSNAKKCDRCGKFYTEELGEISEEWWRYNVTRDCYPYETITKDLCRECKEALMVWLGERGEI